MPPPPRRAAVAPAPSTSFAWPSLAPEQAQQEQQRLQAQQQRQTSSFAWPSLAPGQQQQQQAQQRTQHKQAQQQRQTSSFAWPSLQPAGLPTAGEPQRLPPVRQLGPQQPTPSASVNFSMPAISDLPSPWQQAACQDDASSAQAGQAAASALRVQAEGGAGGTGWLKGLLAEAEYPFGCVGASQASQQQRGGRLGRLPLAERQQLQQAQVSPPGQAAKRAPQQQSPPPQLPVDGSAGMVFGGVDALDIGDE